MHFVSLSVCVCVFLFFVVGFIIHRKAAATYTVGQFIIIIELVSKRKFKAL